MRENEFRTCLDPSKNCSWPHLCGGSVERALRRRQHVRQRRKQELNVFQILISRWLWLQGFDWRKFSPWWEINESIIFLTDFLPHVLSSSFIISTSPQNHWWFIFLSLTIFGGRCRWKKKLDVDKSISSKKTHILRFIFKKEKRKFYDEENIFPLMSRQTFLYILWM